MKILLLTTTLYLVSCAINAKDVCSKQVEYYVRGLETVATLKGFYSTHSKEAVKQIVLIKELQKTLPDCKVVDFIPILSVNQDALKIATKQVKGHM